MPDLVRARTPVMHVTTMEEVPAVATQEQRFTMALMAGFALLALTPAAVEIYGVISYSVRCDHVSPRYRCSCCWWRVPQC